MPSGKPFDVLVLRKILPDAPGLAARRDLRIAYRERADFQRRVEVMFLKRRRYAQRVGDVVEAKRGIVRRQQGSGVDVQCQQIANRVGILGAIQTVQDRPSGVRLRA